jgi:integrase/recombinase XerD
VARLSDVRLGTGAHVRVLGKGRKERCAMLTAETVAVLRQWCRERQGDADEPLFRTRRGGALTPKAVAWLLDKHTTTAAHRRPSLGKKRVTPHVLRHTNAMLLRAQGIDVHTIALWLGHFSGVGDLSRVVSFRTDVRGYGHTFWILCAM